MKSNQSTHSTHSTHSTAGETKMETKSTSNSTTETTSKVKVKQISSRKRAKNKASIRVQAEGCKALSELAYRLEANKQLITDVGGVDVILRAMTDFRKSGRVILEGSRALFSLAIRPLSKSRIVALNGVTTIVKGMMSQPQNAHVQDHGCRLLSEFMYNNMNHVRMVVDAGGVDGILEAMIEHSLLQYNPTITPTATADTKTAATTATTTATKEETKDNENETDTESSSSPPTGVANVEDRGHKALKSFNRRTLFESLCAMFATVRPTESSRLLRVLRLFIVVKTAGVDTSESLESNESNESNDDLNTSTSMEVTPVLLENSEIRKRILKIARDHRSSHPEIWTREVAKSFGAVLKMFKDGRDDSAPPSPTRPMVRTINISRG